MDATNIINSIYKQEVASAIEQKVLYRANLEINKEQMKQKDLKIDQLNIEIQRLHDENVMLKDKLNELQQDGELVEEVIEQCMEN